MATDSLLNLPVRTTCPYCGVGCGVMVQRDDTGGITVKGDPEHPANFGRLCSKGAALGETLDLDGRLLQPEIDDRPCDWDTALGHVAARFTAIIKEHGPEAVAFYVSGQLLTEDYYVANKLMKGFIGSANIDTNSRLCMSSAVAAHKRAFGADAVPCSYEDLEQAELIVLTGSNTAWCHPVLYQRMAKAKQDNPELMVVVIDPRRTASCDLADLHLAIRPGMDHRLFNGLLAYLHAHNKGDQAFIAEHTEGLEAALAEAQNQSQDLGQLAAVCGLSLARLQQFYALFARSDKVVSVFSQGMNQWSYGTDKNNSLINCHLFTGRIGKPGAGPFSFTGQPNAMGGREVGGLANQLAAHMNLDDPEHRRLVQDFWQAPRLAEGEGLKAVDLFRAVAAGKVKAVWVMATNPAVSLPDADTVRRALAGCEFLVVSDCMRNTDTSQYAQVRLPALTWGERSGMVTNSERRISRQRPFLPTPGAAQPDWWIVTEVARRMGFASAFDYQTPQQIFREHAALSAHGNNGRRAFDIGALTTISDSEYETFAPLQWPLTGKQPAGTSRLFTDGRFYTPSGRARFVPVVAHAPANATDSDYPLAMNSGRIRDQWHTMTRTGKSPRLSGHRVEPSVAIHPQDAFKAGIKEGALVNVASRWGSVVVRARITDNQQPGTVFLPMHWNDQYASKGYADALVNPSTDPVSGQPEFKHTPVRIAAYAARWYGFLLSRRRLPMAHASYWACTRGHGLWRYEIAGEELAAEWPAWARTLLCQPADKVEWIEYQDPAQHRYRAARLENGCLESCLFIGADPKLPERDWLVQLFASEELAQQDRNHILTGRPGHGQHDAGRTVCACFGVGYNTIVAAIRDQGLSNPDEIGQALRAGTNCGSCVPELHQIIEETVGR
jgi:assimilatory nitrate reductase catalytic subunit